MLYLGYCYEKIRNYEAALRIYYDFITEENHHDFTKISEKKFLNDEAQKKFSAVLRIVKIREKQYLMFGDSDYYIQAINILNKFNLNQEYKSPSKIPDKIDFIEFKIDLNKIFEENVDENLNIDFLRKFDIKINEKECIFKIKENEKDEIALINYKEMKCQSEVKCNHISKFVDGKKVNEFEFPNWGIFVRFEAKRSSVEIYSMEFEKLLKSFKYNF